MLTGIESGYRTADVGISVVACSGKYIGLDPLLYCVWSMLGCSTMSLWCGIV